MTGASYGCYVRKSRDVRTFALDRKMSAKIMYPCEQSTAPKHPDISSKMFDKTPITHRTNVHYDLVIGSRRCVKEGKIWMQNPYSLKDLFCPVFQNNDFKDYRACVDTRNFSGLEHDLDSFAVCRSRTIGAIDRVGIQRPQSPDLSRMRTDPLNIDYIRRTDPVRWEYICRLIVAGFRKSDLVQIDERISGPRALKILNDYQLAMSELGFSHNDLVQIALRPAGDIALEALCEHATSLRLIGFRIVDLVRIASAVGSAPTLCLLARHGRKLMSNGLTLQELVEIACKVVGAQELARRVLHRYPIEDA